MYSHKIQSRSLNRPLKMALAGLGLIGKSHADIIQTKVPGMELLYIVDPSESAAALATEKGIKHYRSLTELFANNKPDGIVIATPNQLHVENGLESIAASCPILIEKPLATSTMDAQKLVKVATEAKVPLLVGHHRRHNPVIKKAKQIIDAGQIGQIMNVNIMFWMAKPDEYFKPEWRRKNGAGPMMVNTIHDMDLIRYLCGEIESLQAISTNQYRGFENENSGVVLLKFQSGALGTVNISDAIASPWSWEMTSGENPDFDKTNQSSYKIGGTKGSLSMPNLTLWTHGDNGHWKTPIKQFDIEFAVCDPLVEQMRHFEKVIRGKVNPHVTGGQGLRALRVLEAIKESVASGQMVKV